MKQLATFLTNQSCQKARDNMTESEAIKILQRDLQIQLENKALPDGIEAIQIAIQALEKQIPKKPYKDNENGIYEKEYCPICHISLFPNDHHCICGQAIDWSDEE